MKKEIKTATRDIGEILGWIAGIILLCLFIGWIGYNAATLVYDVHGPFAFNEEHIAYQTKDYTLRSKVEVLDIIREKDKEPMYKITLTTIDRQYEIPESTYLKYIGEGANALTIEVSKISMAVKAGNLGSSWNKAKTYTTYRYKIPWTEDTISFTETEVQQFFNMLCEDKAGFRCSNLPFAYHSYTTGWDLNVNLETEYIEWSNRT